MVEKRKIGTPFGPLEKNFLYNGYALKLYSIGWLSYMCNRTQRSIRRWQELHVLPAPIFDVYDGRRWYSAAELIGYTRIVRESGIKPGKESLIGMRQRMTQFKLELKALYKRKPEQIAKELPNSVNIRGLMGRHRESFWISKANKLVSQIGGP